jgi:hypothetical protein
LPPLLIVLGCCYCSFYRCLIDCYVTWWLLRTLHWFCYDV